MLQVSIRVVHCLHAYEVVSREWREYRIRFEKAMVEDSIGPTILIHDETFDDSLHVGVIMNNHSTTKKTAQVAKSYRVYRVILTHFSQCNPKISIFSDNYTSQACIAFIMMSVNLVDLLLVPSLIHFSR